MNCLPRHQRAQRFADDFLRIGAENRLQAPARMGDDPFREPNDEQRAMRLYGFYRGYATTSTL
jgi:hypothetical protein